MTQTTLEVTKTFAKAFRLVNALADGLPRSPRLLLLCGPPGVGKSELLRAGVWRFRARFPHAAIVETDGNGLLDSMIDAARRDEPGQFRRRFATADLLAIDDRFASPAPPPGTCARSSRPGPGRPVST